MAMFACLYVPTLPLACEIAGREGLTGKPVVLADEAGLRVAYASPEAAERGARAGVTLREAVAYCPALAVLEPHPARVARARDALIAAIETVSPFVEDAEPGVLFADLSGLHALYPRAGMAERAALDAAPHFLGVRLGVAAHRFTALAAAHTAAEGEFVRVEAGQAAAFLAPLPVDWLPLDAAEVDWLRLLGIRTAGDLARLPRHAVEAQLGLRGGRAWLAARGEDPAPLRPRPPAHERVLESSQAQPPLVSREAVALVTEQLLGRALRHKRANRRFVRSVRLRAISEDDHLWERTHVMKVPTGDRDRLWTAIRPILEYAEYPGPIAELELELSGLTAESGQQAGLFADYQRRREQLDEMVRHLKIRYGETPVARIVEREPWSRVPERRHALVDYDP